MTQGVDYAWSRPVISQLAAAGKVFACRYGGPGSIGKQLDPAEAQALSAAGVAIVANAEGAADGLLGGRLVGRSWASAAEEHFAQCGMPPGKPIYFSVDFDVQSDQWPAVREALRGCAEVLGGVHRVGVYGGRWAIEWARRDGVARWFWQTFAWSGGVWVPGNHIEQYRNGVPLAGATLDLDRALTSDYGQWKIGDDVALDTKYRGDDGFERTVEQMIVDLHQEIFFRHWSQRGFDQSYGAKLDGLSIPPAATVDIVALAAALRPELVAAAEAAVREVLGGLDNK